MLLRTKETGRRSRSDIVSLLLNARRKCAKRFPFYRCYLCVEFGISATLSALISWLLSLTPNTAELKAEPVAAATKDAKNRCPFYVIGMQRLLVDGQLSVFVAVTPSQIAFSDSSKNKRGKVCRLFALSHLQYLSSIYREK